MLRIAKPQNHVGMRNVPMPMRNGHLAGIHIPNPEPACLTRPRELHIPGRNPLILGEKHYQSEVKTGTRHNLSPQVMIIFLYHGGYTIKPRQHVDNVIFGGDYFRIIAE